MADWPYSTAAWRNLRAAKLALAPLCEACALRGETRPAKAVDHVTPIAAGGDPFPSFDGLMALCVPCHSEKTANVDRAGGKGVRFKGAGLDGAPIDPTHPWFAGGDTPSGDGEPADSGPRPKVRFHLVRAV